MNKYTCMGKYKINKHGDIYFEKDVSFICNKCMEELIQDYTYKMNKIKARKGEKQ
jgi:hypothetical protein